MTGALSLLVLAQDNSTPNSPAVPRLPAPPVIAHYLCESPWLLMLALLASGIIAFIVLNGRAKLTLGLATLAASALLAGAVWALNAAITTEREVLSTRTRELINATATVQLSALRSALSDSVRVTLAGVPFRSGKQAVLDDVVRVLSKQYPVSSVEIVEVQATIDGPNVARTQVRVRAKPSAAMYDAPIGSWWRIDWRRDLSSDGKGDGTGDGEWRVVGLDMLQIDYFGDPSKLRP